MSLVRLVGENAIAQAAGVNQALIGYHFGGKHGLYLAVFGHIVSHMQQRMVPVGDEVMRRLQFAPQNPAARRDLALELMLLMFDAYTDMIGDRAAAGWVRLILREQQDPTEAFQLLYDTIFSRLLELLAQFVAVASGVEPGAEEERCPRQLDRGGLTREVPEQLGREERSQNCREAGE